VQADSGRQAIELLGSGLDVDIVLSDVAMPAMSGAELAARLRELHPGLPVVLVTGYGADHTDDLPADVPVLGKPLAVDALLEVLRERVSPGAR
jgi:CheY-like chemotaxis protein